MKFDSLFLEYTDDKELKLGIEVEKEHQDVYNTIKDLCTQNKIKCPFDTLDAFAEAIAKAHLSEINNYYTLLKEMEAKAKGK